MGTRGCPNRSCRTCLPIAATWFGFVRPTSPEERARALRYGFPNDTFDVFVAPVDLEEIDVMLRTNHE